MPDTYVDPYFSLPQLFFDQFQIQLKKRSSMYRVVRVWEGCYIHYLTRGSTWTGLDWLSPYRSTDFQFAVVSESGRGVIFR